MNQFLPKKISLSYTSAENITSSLAIRTCGHGKLWNIFANNNGPTCVKEIYGTVGSKFQQTPTRNLGRNTMFLLNNEKGFKITYAKISKINIQMDSEGWQSRIRILTKNPPKQAE